MSDSRLDGTAEPEDGEATLGTDGTIPNTEDGIAVGHDPDGSHFNPEEDPDPSSTSAS